MLAFDQPLVPSENTIHHDSAHRILPATLVSGAIIVILSLVCIPHYSHPRRQVNRKLHRLDFTFAIGYQRPAGQLMSFFTVAEPPSLCTPISQDTSQTTLLAKLYDLSNVGP